MINYNFYNPTRLIFGGGTLSELGKQKLHGKKALLLISNGKSAKINVSFDQATSRKSNPTADRRECHER